MIERHVTFKVIPGKEKEFERLFVEEYRPAMSKMKGFRSVYLLFEEDDPQNYQMVIRFDSPEEALAWRSSPEHQALQPKIKSLYEGSQVKVYRVVS
ncbi:MAG: antibiotic biosynthesis monooxygenase [Caldiserica bacterium]|jgi:heme-degrading monooxygenase HmoA|nr:antibiotic biosynthesis monooxygenase [Caldisericota bacterium]MDH7563193.1 antibiotic biosynthesis monooxygenase [Caldisericota bacterium]